MKIRWEKGSKNSTAIRMFEEKGILWEYNHFGQLTAKIGSRYRKVEFKRIKGDTYEIVTE